MAVQHTERTNSVQVEALLSRAVNHFSDLEIGRRGAGIRRPDFHSL
jgi:hypothetical protein